MTLTLGALEKSLLAELDHCYQHPLPLRVITRDIPWTTFDALKDFFDSLEGMSGLRTCYYENQLRISYLPSEAHEVACCELTFRISFALCKMNPENDDCLLLLGHATFRNAAKQVSLEADSTMCPSPGTRPSKPILLIECRDSDSYAVLLEKTDQWFANFESVQGAIVINIHRDTARTVEIEVWRRDDTAAIGRSLHVRVTMKPGSETPPLLIPYTCIFPNGPPSWASAGSDLILSAADMKHACVIVKKNDRTERVIPQSRSLDLALASEEKLELQEAVNNEQ
ncbi:hypothetical protein C8J56DRAFT_1095297 [Mycena floridula]|nr:hypothetical protein C8J56DRAFT_1095297 [Mycena floridula]